MKDGPTIGVLGLQGAFARHIETLSELGVEARRVRTPDDLADLDGMVLPGGESTTMGNLLGSSGLLQPLTTALSSGLPVLGTCAGLILLAQRILDGRSDQVSFGVLDVTVRRNGYGRQVDSFEGDVEVRGLGDPFHAVFIRAPIIEDVGESVEVLSSLDGHPILVRQARVMACSFP
ncbi:MAG: pyridoxal 5'-phosphate synthase glutaminase subunit PdxT, partial [Ilumatobacteraceae bacterium]